MQPNGDWNCRSGRRDLEIAGSIQEVDRGAIVVDEGVERRDQRGEILEEGKKVFSN